MDLLLQYIDGRFWQLIQPVVYKPRRGAAVFVPAGFVTDFASIPRFFWRVIGPPTGAGRGAAYGKAAVVHDFLYCNPGSRSRKQCDDVFLELMTDDDVTPTRRRLMYLAVRVGGWHPWRTYRQEQDQRKRAA